MPATTKVTPSQARRDAARAERNLQAAAGFEAGDPVEFWSGQGVWKFGVVDYVHKRNNTEALNLRIQVGEKVFVVRPVKKCRPVEGY